MKIVSLPILLISFVGLTAAKNTKSKSIYQIASETDDLSALVDLIDAAGLDKVLDKCNGDTMYTVFAPENNGVEALNDSAVKTLLKPKNKDLLQSLVLYHTIAGNKRIYSSDIVNGKVKQAKKVKYNKANSKVKLLDIEAANGEDLDLRVKKNGKVKVNKSTVIGPLDIQACNGVIHIINEVMIPTEVCKALKKQQGKNRNLQGSYHRMLDDLCPVFYGSCSICGNDPIPDASLQIPVPGSGAGTCEAIQNTVNTLTGGLCTSVQQQYAPTCCTDATLPPTPQPTWDKCYICGDASKTPTDTQFTVTLNNNINTPFLVTGTYTCSELDTFGRNGQLHPTQCQTLLNTATPRCGCV